MATFNAFQAQITIPTFSSSPSDVVQNTLAFQFTPITAPTAGDFLLLHGRINGFYNTIYNGTGSQQFGAWMRPAAASIKMYNLSDPHPRVPVYMAASPYNNTTGTAISYPPEVAVCCSFQGTKVSGLKQARRRGRIYLGGFNAPNNLGTTTAFPNLAGPLQAAIASAAAALIPVVNNWQWVVYSRVNDAVTPVTNGWVDNQFDTIRGRGQKTGTRATF